MQTTQLGELEEVQVLQEKPRLIDIASVPEQEMGQGSAKARKRLPPSLVALAVCSFALCGLISLYALSAFSFAERDQQITLKIYGETQTVSSQQPTVQALLEELGVTLAELDVLLTPPDTELTDGLTVEIERRYHRVLVQADGRQYQPVGEPATVAEALHLAGVGLSRLDEVNLPPDTPIEADTIIEVTRVVSKIITETEVIAPASSRIEDATLAAGTSQVLQEGTPGLREVTVRVTYRGGEELEREVIESRVLEEPGTSIITYGSMSLASCGENGAFTATTASGTSFSYVRSLTVESTAYTWTGNRTATGTWPTVGQIAVDPSVIPLGSTVYVEGYGFATATDTGGAIRGNIIDVYFDTYEECISWGRRHNLTVYILE